MSVTSVKNENMVCYQGEKSRVNVEQTSFTLGEADEAMVNTQKSPSEVTDKFAGMSSKDFLDLLNNDSFKKYKIPVVNQIVSSRNPADGEIYVMFFTDDKITCNKADGGAAWEIDVDNAEQAEKVKDFFKGYTPYSWAKEIYSGDNMGMVACKDFWLDLFHKKDEV